MEKCLEKIGIKIVDKWGLFAENYTMLVYEFDKNGVAYNVRKMKYRKGSTEYLLTTPEIKKPLIDTFSKYMFIDYLKNFIKR